VKASFIERNGGPEVIIYGDLPDPIAGAGEVLIDVHAASLNRADKSVRSGALKAPSFPCILGRDFSGTVTALGEGVTDLKIGDAVFGVLEGGREGTYCEKLTIKSAIFALKPDNLSHAEAASLALQGLTAIVSLEDTLKLKRGETILINGGAGSVGAYAIQLAKHLGAKVITTARGDSLNFVRSLGADEAIDYKTQDFTKVVSVVDAEFDCVGGDVATRSFAVLKSGGRAAFIASGAQAPKPDRDDVTALRPAVGRARAPLERIVELYQGGAVKPLPIKLYRLDQAADAHRDNEGARFRGKLVLQMR
jgi:NADPH:quinone reductase-like Zn-dependent oxidoreductase